MLQPPVVCIGFITYGGSTAPYLGAFLKSLKAQTYPAVRIAAFDNTPESENENSEILRAYPDIAVLRGDGNLGFSAAYNKLIARAAASQADYFFVVNPDTILEADVIEKLVAALESDSSAGSAAPEIRKWNFEKNEKTGIIDSRGIGLRPGLRFFDIDQAVSHENISLTQPLGPSGAAGLYRISALEKIARNGQYFDERFFMYKEDCDLAYRLYGAGYGCISVTRAVMYHDRTATGATLGERLLNRRSRSLNANRWAFINQHYLYIKHWNKENVTSKLLIIGQVAIRFFYALIFEQVLLSAYKDIWTFLLSSSRGTSKTN